MNILHVVPTFYPATYWGGPIFSLHALCNALAARPGFELKVVTTDAAGPRLAERLNVAEFPVRYAAGYEVYFSRRRWGREISLGLLGQLWAMIRWADVVHLTGTYSFPVIPALLLCRVFGRPVVWSPRGGLQRWAGSSRPWAKLLWERVCNALLVKGRAVLHVTSEKEGKESGLRIPRAEIACVPNGVELPAMPANRRWKPEGRLRLLYMGRLDPKKGIENLLKALVSLSDIDLQLMICGRGVEDYEEKLQRLVAQLRLGGRVRFLGQVDGVNKAHVVFHSDLCVVPSFTENFGMVVAEALAHGVPVIASQGTPWAGLVQRGCGMWVENSPQSLAGAIALMSQSNLELMGDRGRKWMERDFCWRTIAGRISEVYVKLASDQQAQLIDSRNRFQG